MIDILWQTNIFRLNLKTASQLVDLDPTEQYQQAVLLLPPAVQHFLAKGYGKDIDFAVYPQTVVGVVPTFCAVWFVKGGHKIAFADPRQNLTCSDQFVPRPWICDVDDGDLFIFPAYVEHDTEVEYENITLTFDIVATERI